MAKKILETAVDTKTTVIDSISVENARYNALAGQLSEKALNELNEAVMLRKRQAAVAIDAANSEIAVHTSGIISEMIQSAIQPDVIEKVCANIETPKDLLDYSRALNEFRTLMMKSQIETSDPDKANTRTNAKISIAFKNGNIAVSAEG